MINTLNIFLISFINISNMNNMIYVIGYKYYLLELTSSHSIKWKIIEINKNLLEVNHGIRKEDIIGYSIHIEN